MRKNNKMIVLIGMPGAGKSTVGVVLAKRLGRSFIDSDLVIQEKTGKKLHQLIEELGVEGFIRLENDINKRIDQPGCVLATGGSAVYGTEAMRHFQNRGTLVYLRLPYREIENRLGDLNKRGVLIKEGQTLRELYDERSALYEKYADIIIDCDGRLLRETVCETAEKFEADL